MTVRLLDIEGTVCPITFVKDTLFPFARARLAAFVERNGADPGVQDDLLAAAQLAGRAPDDVAGIVATLLQWIDEDQKVTPLKSLQGRIWREGWDSGAFVAPLYPDVVPTLRGWKAAGDTLAVFSSGSVEAQRQLFGHTNAGDLLELFSAFFDTTVGSKRSAAAYAAIAAALGVAPGEVVFYSDIVEELDAARDAGVVTALITRDGWRGPTGGHAASATLPFAPPVTAETPRERE